MSRLEAEFEKLVKSCGDVFFRTVKPTTFRGKEMTSDEFASQLWVADLLELNGPGARFYGDGLYVTSSVWYGYELHDLTDSLRQSAKEESLEYGEGSEHTFLEMTWVREPRLITDNELGKKWEAMSFKEQDRFGEQRNTYGADLGYDGMYCSGPNYIVIWNRSIIAVKKQ